MQLLDHGTFRHWGSSQYKHVQWLSHGTSQPPFEYAFSYNGSRLLSDFVLSTAIKYFISFNSHA